MNKSDTALLSVLTAGGMLASTDSLAVSIYSGVQDIDVALNSSFLLDIDSDGTDDLQFSNNVTFGGLKGDRVDQASVLVDGLNAAYRIDPNSWDPLDPGSAEPAVLPAGFVIDPTVENQKLSPLWGGEVGTMAEGSNDPTFGFKTDGPWLGVTRQYLGVQWDEGKDPATGTDLYRAGWVQLSVSSLDINNPLELTIHDWAYESEQNVSLVAGDTGPAVIPLPGSLVLFASGAAGLMAFRRSRRQSKAEPDSGAQAVVE